MDKKPRIKSGYLIGAVIYLAVSIILLRMEYNSYIEKMTIFSEVVEAEKNGEEIFPVITHLLKNSAREGKIESDKLIEYGYLQKHISIQKKQMYHHCALIMALTTFAAAAAALGIGREQWLRRKEGIVRLERLNDQIRQLRDGKYHLDSTFNAAGKSDIEIEGINADETMQRLNMDMASLAEQLELVTQAARQEKEETKALVTDLSHQLKTPVAALKASFEILGGADLTMEEQEEFTLRCTGQIERLEELVNALMQISRMETGMIEVRLEEKSILDTIRMAVNRIYVKAQEKNIDISMEIQEADRELTVMQDVKWLSEALLNLLENAIKYSGSNTKIQIRLERRTTFLRLEIEDEGIGVPREERSQIFKRFYRGKSERVEKENGSGIGLYLTRMIIEQHGGTIIVRSPKQSQTRGSIFVIQIPSIK